MIVALERLLVARSQFGRHRVDAHSLWRGVTAASRDCVTLTARALRAVMLLCAIGALRTVCMQAYQGLPDV